MAQAVVKQHLDLPAERVWALVADFGDISWMPAGTPVELEGSGPGMTRLIGAGDHKIREQLESLDDASRSLVYAISEGIPFPVTGYRATMKVAESGGGCELQLRAGRRHGRAGHPADRGHVPDHDRLDPRPPHRHPQ